MTGMECLREKLKSMGATDAQLNSKILIISPRDCYNQIKAFYYDAINSLLKEWQESENN